MNSDVKEVTRLRGVGPVLGRRLVEAGLAGFDAIVEAGEEGLKVIQGLNPRMIPSILSQAAEMNAAAAEGAFEIGDLLTPAPRLHPADAAQAWRQGFATRAADHHVAAAVE